MDVPERVIDAERAGGTGNAAPKRVVGADPVGLDEAMARVDDMEWRQVRTRSHQVMIALRDEVERLSDERNQALGYLQNLFHEVAPQCTSLDALLGLCTQIDNYIAGTREELARLRAALSDVIACPHGDGTTCTRDNYGWSLCCSLRLRMGKAGLISAPVRAAERDDMA